jgi:hypothetical protein
MATKLKQFGLFIFTYIPVTLYPRMANRNISGYTLRPTFYQNYFATRNTADMTSWFDRNPPQVLVLLIL